MGTVFVIQLMPTAIRPELEIIRTGPDNFLVRDPASGGAFEVGGEERFLLRLLDGRSSIEQIRQNYESRFERPFSEPQFLAFVSNLREIGLTHDSPSPEEPQPVVALKASAPAPLSTADPGAKLNHRFDGLVLLFGWLVHPAWIPVVTGSMLYSAMLLAHRGSTMLHDLQQFKQSTSALAVLALWLIVTRLCVNLPVEIFSGLACRRYGGRIRCFELRLHNGLFPHFVCDTGDSFARLPDRGKWATLSARLWGLAGIVSLASLVWSAASQDSLLRVLTSLVLMPAAISLLVQLIPFFQLEGYRLLCVYSGQPDLHRRTVAEANAWTSFQNGHEALTRAERFRLRLYGILSYVWNLAAHACVLIFVGTWLIDEFQGVGALALGVFYLVWNQEVIGRRVMATSAYQWLVRAGGKWWVRWPVRIVLLTAAVAVAFIPYNFEVVGKCRVIPLAQSGIRPQISDEIVQVHVREGDRVKEGDKLISLSGREVMNQLLQTEAELERSEAELTLLKAGTRPEEIAIAEHNVELWKARVAAFKEDLDRELELEKKGVVTRAEIITLKRTYDVGVQSLGSSEEFLKKARIGPRPEEIKKQEAVIQEVRVKLRYYQQQQELIDLASPISGRVVTPHLQERIGQRPQAGELIAVIQDLSELRVEVAADEAAAACLHVEQPVSIRLNGLYGRLLTGKVLRIALATEDDSTIDITAIRTDKEVQLQNSLQTEDQRNSLRVIVQLDENQEPLTPGMVGYARIHVQDDVLWTALARPVVRFLRTEVWSWLP